MSMVGKRNLWLVVLTAAMMTMLPAHADQSRPRWWPDAGRGGYQQPRDSGRGQDSVRPVQRLSQEERRQLRQDIRNAGREIYPPQR